MMTEGKRIRILNVEDEEVDHLALVRMIKEKGLSYDAEQAASIAEALELFSKNKYDIVLLDYQLPDGTGLDLLEKMMGTPSIFVTGSGDEMVAVKAIKGGAYDYIIKDRVTGYLELLPTTIEKAQRAFYLEEERKRAEMVLWERLDEIERLNKFMVGRELKMEEMKKEIEKLKAKVEELEAK